jgi:Tol biopolymer transport system component
LISKAQSSGPRVAEGEDSLRRAALIREQLERTLISPGFANSGRMCQFLRFVVENSIGAGQCLKETVIGVEVFGRAPGYDPSLEPIVRVEARRLRDKLEQYYAGQGANDSVLITLPKGGYTPEFSFQEAPTLRLGQEQPELSLPVPSTRGVQNGAAPQRVVGWIWKRWSWNRWIAVLLLLAGAGTVWYALELRTDRRRPAAFQDFAVTQVTNTGTAAFAAISPDGKYILRVENANGKEALWLQNVPTKSNVRIVEPSGATYRHLTFSPDGNYIYFLEAADNTGNNLNLYRAPVLGGEPRQIVRDVDSDIAFSPNGNRMAYFRGNDPISGQSRLLNANADGTDEKVLSVQNTASPALFLSWTPDGKQIAYAFRQARVGPKILGGLELFDLASAKSSTLATFTDKVLYELHWLPNGRGLAVCYGARPTIFQRQIGYVAYRGGGFRTITRDANSYRTLTVSEDGNTIATVQVKTTHTVDLIPGAGTKETSPTPILPGIPDAFGLSWAGDKELLLTNGSDLIQVSVDGTSRRTLASDAAGNINSAQQCGEQHVVLSWSFHGGSNGARIWRLNADGSGAKQLTDGKGDFNPVCSLDGKWVYYQDPGEDHILRVPIEGGSPEIVPGTAVSNAGISAPLGELSPDGKQMPFFSDSAFLHKHLQIVNLDAGPNPMRCTLSPDPRVSGAVMFTPDEKAVAYPILENGVSNIWVQPLDGSPGRQITNFKSGTFRNFSWSPNGKSLAIIREMSQSDVVLLRSLSQAGSQ